MKSGVEAGDIGHSRKQSHRCLDPGDRRRIVERRQLGEPFQALLDRGIELDRARELGAAVDDAVSDRVDFANVADERGQCAIRVLDALEVLARNQLITGAENPQLERGRAGVDDEDPIGRH